jgi:hypothetical protein
MSFTRFHDDECRIEKQLQESTDPGRYMINAPGNGREPCYMQDPYMRMQKWGGNLMTNTINLESDLRGLTRNINHRDCIKENDYKSHAVYTRSLEYPTRLPFTEQPRAIMPAWTVKDLEQTHWDFPLLDPQENTCLTFQNNLSTRILEKDHYLVNGGC